MSNILRRNRSRAVAAVSAGLLLFTGCQPDDVAMFVQDLARQLLAAYLL